MSRSMGARYQVITAVIAAPRTMSPPVTRASLTASHRARGTVWLQASRQVPYSSSLAISDPPTRTPISPGTIRATDQNAMLTSEPNSFMKSPTAVLAAGSLAAGQARGQVVVAERRAHRGALDDRVHREGGEQGQAGYRLAAVLAPGNPDHCGTAFVFGPAAPACVVTGVRRCR